MVVRPRLYRGCQWAPTCFCRMSNYAVYAYFGTYTALRQALMPEGATTLPIGLNVLAGGCARLASHTGCPVTLLSDRRREEHHANIARYSNATISWVLACGA